MGLTIHFKLRFKGTSDEAQAAIWGIRTKAENLTLASLSGVRAIPADHRNCLEEDRWAAIQYQDSRYYGKSCPFHPEGRVGPEFGKMAGEKCLCGFSIDPVEGWYF